MTPTKIKRLRHVVNVDRVQKVTGGKMRPRLKVWWVCTLDCGHVVEKIKNRTNYKPPAKMACSLGCP